MMTFNEDKHYFSNYSTLNDELPDFDRILTKQLRHEKAHQLLMDVNDVNRQYAHENCMFESMERVERDHYQKRGEQFTHTSQSQAIHHLRENEERARHVLSTSFPQSVEEAHLERKSLREEFIKSVENFHNRLNESMNTLQEFNRLYTEHLSALRNLEQAMQWLNADLLSKTRQNQFQQCIKTCPARETINQIKNSISALDAVGMENTGKKLLEELKQLQEINNIDGFPVYFADNWEQLHERVFQFANQRSSILDEIEKLCQSHDDIMARADTTGHAFHAATQTAVADAAAAAAAHANAHANAQAARFQKIQLEHEAVVEAFRENKDFSSKYGRELNRFVAPAGQVCA